MSKIIIQLNMLLLGIFLISSCAPSKSSTKSAANSEVVSKSHINRVRIAKSGSTGDLIEFKIRGGRGQIGTSTSGPQNIRLQGSSGTQEVSSFKGFKDINFPFEGTIRFDYQKQSHDAGGSVGGNQESLSTKTTASVKVKIDEPGRWIVTITY